MNHEETCATHTRFQNNRAGCRAYMYIYTHVCVCVPFPSSNFVFLYRLLVLLLCVRAFMCAALRVLGIFGWVGQCVWLVVFGIFGCVCVPPCVLQVALRGVPVRVSIMCFLLIVVGYMTYPTK